MVIDPSSLKFQICQARKQLQANHLNLEEAERTLLSILDDLSSEDPDYGLVTYLLSLVYQQTGFPDLRKQYLAMSAINDIKHSRKDIASLQTLALMYYEQGRVDQAYKFMKSAIDDITCSKMRFRMTELSSFYSTINTAYVEKEAKQKRKLVIYLTLISLLSIVLIIFGLFVYYQMRKVSKIRKELFNANLKLEELNENMQFTNQQLHELNTQLSEANRIKEEYIALFFDRCSSYIDKWEEYRRMLNKKAASNQLNELFGILKSNTLVEEERRKLYETFDIIFLNLYPTFVEEFNALFTKEEQIIPKPGELNTELRIFALIRLGISNSNKIAEFLHYSLKTVYNYRTKARTNAIVSRENFENLITKIGFIQDK
jgi:hypothetical protein